ncbi:hypothetical protein FEM48_ZijujUnG0031800 [Ziziphus jujuba var. spinosa]|uniref:RING-type E3 ubiquitin transferase n=1 Tax=Ziziphus jujuba var. spinosa TaxID=714518 RepID=A0A978U9J3_ZIZJJ|nr:hypothetical protein FEM48_ZijujUnG0031800 [Ziziphus jujuba var. spinosa]
MRRLFVPIRRRRTGPCVAQLQHAFHVQCIDAWFQSHSNCPLCRAPVRSDFPVHLPETSTQTIITVNEQPEVEAELRGSSESSMPEVLSSEWCRRKPMELESVAVEVPCTRVRSMDEMGLGSHEFGSHRQFIGIESENWTGILVSIRSYKDVEVWVKVAISDADQCESALKGKEPAMVEKNQIFRQLCNNVLAIVKVLAEK